MSNNAKTDIESKVGHYDSAHGTDAKLHEYETVRIDHHDNIHKGDHSPTEIGHCSPIFYVIDPQTLKAGNAIISLKDNTASPAPLGLLGFGLTTFLLNLHNAGAYPMNSMIMAMGICYGGLVQIIAGIFEFQRGDLFGMIAFLSYGFFWWSLIILVAIPKMGAFAVATDHTAMGCYLFIWGLFSLCMFAATLFKRAPWVLSWIFFTVVVLFWLLAARHWANSEVVEQIAGVEGVICGLSAIYLAFA